jgi:FAD/FMN-containing dehydrogenase
MGGKIDDKKSTDTAYFARGAKMLTSVDLGWLPKDQPKLAENLAWLDKFHKEMEQYTSKYSYVNFIDRNQSNFLDAYYGSNLEKLKTIKKKLDPNNFFNYPQGIPLV